MARGPYYAYYWMDSKGVPFYVGKGIKDRAFQHRGREDWPDDDVTVRMIACGSEQDALNLEADLFTTFVDQGHKLLNKQTLYRSKRSESTVMKDLYFHGPALDPEVEVLGHSLPLSEALSLVRTETAAACNYDLNRGSFCRNGHSLHELNIPRFCRLYWELLRLKKQLHGKLYLPQFNRQLAVYLRRFRTMISAAQELRRQLEADSVNYYNVPQWCSRLALVDRLVSCELDRYSSDYVQHLLDAPLRDWRYDDWFKEAMAKAGPEADATFYLDHT